MRRLLMKAEGFTLNACLKVKEALGNENGENYVDTGVKILIAVVIGALLLAGLYALFGDVVMPTLEKRITDMFNYNG